MNMVLSNNFFIFDEEIINANGLQLIQAERYISQNDPLQFGAILFWYPYRRSTFGPQLTLYGKEEKG
jgi:hypothetical protein